MKIQGNDYNFGRVVYLTIGRLVNEKNELVDPYKYMGLPNEKLIDMVTVAFDPKTNPQLNTRIDFLIRHQNGSVSSVTGAAQSLASIDLYNIGPALQQFMNAYNQDDNKGDQWIATKTIQYVCALQIGYHDAPLHTVFAGVINSYNVERKQNNSTVDTVWHLFCGGTGGYSYMPLFQSKIATSGLDYSTELQEQNNMYKSFLSGEEYIKTLIKSERRQVYVMRDRNKNYDIGEDSFSVLSNVTPQVLVGLPEPIEIDNKNFSKYFKIRYSFFNDGDEEEWTKSKWQNEPFTGVLNLDSSELDKAINQIAQMKNCGGEVRLDEDTGIQTIHIYSTAARKASLQKKTNYVITNFQNLRKPPLVSGVSIRFDMMLEPKVKPFDTFELRVTDDFKTKRTNDLNNFSFDVDFGGNYGNWATVFAGSNFDGISNTVTNLKTKKAAEQTGNVFNKKFVAINVMHQGSTHTPEWATQVDCANVEY